MAYIPALVTNSGVLRSYIFKKALLSQVGAGCLNPATAPLIWPKRSNSTSKTRLPFRSYAVANVFSQLRY
jgi:hypothetical protein